MIARIYPLKELCLTEITDGTHKTPVYSESGYKFLSSKNVTSGEIDWENIVYIPEELHNELYNRLSPHKDDILLAKNGTTGVAAIVDIEEIFDIYVSLALIRPNPDLVFPKYLLYAINSDQSKRFFDSHLKGIGVPNLHLTHIRETPIPIPDMDMQKHIAHLFDKVNTTISLRKQQLAKLDELVKARFVEMFGDPVLNPFGWKQTTLKNVAVRKLSYGSGASSCAYDGNIRYVRITDIDDNGELNDDVVSPNLIEEKYLLNDGDIIFARSGATVGKTYRYRKTDGKCLYAGYLIRMIPDQSQVLPDYIFYYTKTSYYENFIASNMKVVAQPNINAQQYGDLIICVPPLCVQQNFVFMVQKICRHKLTIQQSLDKLEVLKKALMQEYFG